MKPGDTLGRFVVGSRIGAGGMGEVFEAEDPSLERKVALKVLGSDVADSPERLARFVREAKSASALNHPNILTIFEITKSDGINYIVSEYVDGVTLKGLIVKKKLSMAKALDIAIQTAGALSAAHDAGIVHRDIKPANIMVRRDGIVKVVDFGIAKLIQPNYDPEVHGEAPTLSQIGTEPGMMIGTPRYMSPEQARGKAVDNRSDIFSLGLVFYELFTGKRAFDGESSVDVLSSILKDDHRSMRSLNPEIPQALDHIVEKALRKDLDHRYQDVRDLLIDLEDVRDDLKVGAKLERGGITAASEPIHLTDADTADITGNLTTGIVKTRRFTILHAMGFVFVALALGAAYWWYDSSTHEAAAFPSDLKIEEVATWSSAPGELFVNASFSPDGKLIAFSSTRNGTKDIWVTQTGSTEAIAITKSESQDQYPVWSPKGDEIAFFSQRKVPEGESSTGIWRVSALGGTPRLVGTVSDGSSIVRSWGESGKIYFESKKGLWAIGADNGKISEVDTSANADWIGITSDESTLIMASSVETGAAIRSKDLASGNVEEIATFENSIGEIAWLPDLSAFFFSGESDGIEQVYGVTPGNEPQKLTALDEGASVAAASDRGVLYTTAREESNIWMTDVAGGNESAVARDLNSELWPSVSPDSKRIAYQSIKGLNQGNKLFEGAVVIRDLDDPNASPVEIAEQGFLPSFSSDGRTVAFLRIENGKRQLVAADVAGGRQKILESQGLQPVAYSVHPYSRVQSSEFSWQPEGSKILYVSEKSGSQEIWSVDTGEDGAPARVTELNDKTVSLYSPFWSRDGSIAAFYMHAKQEDPENIRPRSLWTVDPAGGEAKKIYEDPDLFRFLGWSAGGGLLVASGAKFKNLQDEVVVKEIPAAGGEAREVTRLSNAYFYNIVISPAGDRLAFVSRRSERDDVWVTDVAGGQKQRITENNDSGVYFSSLAWSPDGKRIFFGKQTRFSLLSLITNLNAEGE